MSAVTGIVTIAIIVIVRPLFALHRLDILSAMSYTPKHGSRPPPDGAPEAAQTPTAPV